MKTLKTPLSVTSSVIAISLLLSACSSDETVTTLDARPVVTIGLPQVLLDSNSIDQSNISPTILLSNGASVTMQPGVGDAWNGTINVAPAAQYTATVTWAEFFDGRLLPLARLQQTLEVTADGTVVVGATSEYSTTIDTDGDRTSNLDERENGTDPFTADDQNEPTNNAGGNQLDTPASDDSEAETVAEANQSLTTGPAIFLTPETPAETTLNPVTAEADTVVPRIATSEAPKIDGNDVSIDSDGQLTGEWAAAIQVDGSGAPLLINNLIIDIDAESPDGAPFRRWAAMHDGTHLYVVVIVDDNGDRQRDSLSDLTQDDSLELFLDGDNSKSTNYGADDYHRIFPVRLPGVDKRSADRGDVAGPNSSPTGLIVTFATGPGIGPRGIRTAHFEQDVYELKIDLASAGIDTNAVFGFELQINDDDGGDDRDSKWAWKHPSRSTTDVDSTIDDPSVMGTLKLE
ncbi:MAG: hypothetical protein ACJAZF_000534 [Granulosicoccus sp.]|jgi:hypothetical protein